MMARHPECKAGGRLVRGAWRELPGQPAPEVSAYRAALEEDLTDSRAWLNYAVSLSDFYWWNREAANAVSMAIALDPFVAEYHFFRGYCHQKLGLLQEAAADLEMAWKIDADHQNAGYYLGQTYFYLGEYERARTVLERVTRISPPEAEWAAICNWLYLTLRMLGRDEEAAKVAAKIGRSARPAEATGTLGNTWTDCQYLLSCWAYNGFISPEEAIMEAGDYGALNRWYVTMYMALYCELNGDDQSAVAFYERTIATFGEINGTETTKMDWIIQPRLRALRAKQNR